jgi:hypothetical protein
MCRPPPHPPLRARRRSTVPRAGLCAQPQPCLVGESSGVYCEDPSLAYRPDCRLSSNRERIATCTPRVNRVTAAHVCLPRRFAHPTEAARPPHVGTIRHSRDSDLTLARYPLWERHEYRQNTTRYLRIPHGRGVTEAWYSLHSSVCERTFPTLPPLGGEGSRAVVGLCPTA